MSIIASSREGEGFIVVMELDLKLHSKPHLKEKRELGFHIVYKDPGPQLSLGCGSLRKNSNVALIDLCGLNSKAGWDFSHRKLMTEE